METTIQKTQNIPLHDLQHMAVSMTYCIEQIQVIFILFECISIYDINELN